jgi:hypothetical protein
MAETTEQTPAETATDPWTPWRNRIAASRRRRDEKVYVWQENVAKRTKTPDNYTTTTEVSINPDWSLTKAKIAQLYSQTPTIRLTVRQGMEAFTPAIQPFGRELNDILDSASVGTTIEEVLSDVINAAGIGAVLVSCEKRTEKRMVPEMDPATLPPDIQQALLTGAFEMPMTEVDAVVDIQYLVTRISPADLLIPSDFTGSNYDHARWLGHDGRMTWAQAQVEFGLTDEQKDEVLSGDKRAKGTTNTLSTDTNKFRDTEVVTFSEVFYWCHYYDPADTSFKAMKRVVFVDGLDEPVVVEPYKAQIRVEDGIVGVTKNPIRVLTLTYISDESLPPSDSSVSRFTVDELEQSRNSMLQQRKHSVPIRWYNPNMVSPGTKSLLEKGTPQGFVPIANGERGIGEVARATFPPEKFEIDAILKNELAESWQVGTNQVGAFAKGERSAREAGIIERNYQRRIGQEQDKVQKFLLGIAEVLAGHLAMYGTFDLPDELGPMRQQMANAFLYTARVDSTVRMDVDERIEKLTTGLNLTAQSGYVNPKPIIAEIWELLGVDPATCVIDPQPKAPEPVKVSIGSAEDIINPVMLAAMMRTGQAPGPDDVAAAIKLLTMAAAGGVPLVPPEPSPDKPQGEVEHPKGSNLEWEASPRVDRRPDDGGAP